MSDFNRLLNINKNFFKKLSRLHHHNRSVILHKLLYPLWTLVLNQYYLLYVLESLLGDAIHKVAGTQIPDEIHLQIDDLNVFTVV